MSIFLDYFLLSVFLQIYAATKPVKAKDYAKEYLVIFSLYLIMKELEINKDEELINEESF